MKGITLLGVVISVGELAGGTVAMTSVEYHGGNVSISKWTRTIWNIL